MPQIGRADPATDIAALAGNAATGGREPPGNFRAVQPLAQQAGHIPLALAQPVGPTPTFPGSGMFDCNIKNRHLIDLSSEYSNSPKL